jgi:GH15 family glucan-1,4-alpha-glucosidase
LPDTSWHHRAETRLSLALPRAEASRRLTAPALPDIEDYALIGDCRTAALVSNTGSIDWLCLPHFHSPSFFNRLLDHVHGGYFAIAPVEPCTVRRSYQDSTAVLVTEFQTDTGIVRLPDCMPVAAEETKPRRLMPFRAVLRYVEGMQGTVELNVVFKPRPDHLPVPQR